MSGAYRDAAAADVVIYCVRDATAAVGNGS